jgi:hypothetical protein
LGTSATGCTLAGLSTLSRHCFRELPSTVDYPEAGLYNIDIQWAYGPAFFCMMFAVVLQMVNVVFHLLTPTAKHGASQPNNGVNTELLET